MRVIYRLNFGPGKGYTENEDRSILEGIKETQGGTIESYQIEVHVMRGDVQLATYDTADEADTECERRRQEAVAEIAQEFHIVPVKTLLEPQPEAVDAVV